MASKDDPDVHRTGVTGETPGGSPSTILVLPLKVWSPKQLVCGAVKKCSRQFQEDVINENIPDISQQETIVKEFI